MVNNDGRPIYDEAFENKIHQAAEQIKLAIKD